MNILTMRRKDFMKVPERKWGEPLVPFDSLVIIPRREMHDSGFLMMDFVAVNARREPIVRISGCSDVLHIDGLGGYGNWKPTQRIPVSRPIEGWTVDCLPCGYLRIMCRGRITCGEALSEFEIFFHPMR